MLNHVLISAYQIKGLLTDFCIDAFQFWVRSAIMNSFAFIRFVVTNMKAI